MLKSLNLKPTDMHWDFSCVVAADLCLAHRASGSDSEDPDDNRSSPHASLWSPPDASKRAAPPGGPAQASPSAPAPFFSADVVVAALMRLPPPAGPSSSSSAAVAAAEMPWGGMARCEVLHVLLRLQRHLAEARHPRHRLQRAAAAQAAVRLMLVGGGNSPAVEPAALRWG